ncbi:hypothetical protein D9757_012763 [Collybiopsis confluens]|uniref:Uncharacterized protein n=1 Tax=Collybiopsis confluens TaxID=2823264 RepID=A0A8H5GL10_9AGAR|nr:hypothetical protein D9757_012763 [Collybiopsis confluens]
MSLSAIDDDDDIYDLDIIDSALASLSEKQIEALAKHTSFIGTKDGRLDGHSPAAILDKADVQLDSQDKGYYLQIKGDRLEFSVTVCPKSNYSWKNGPEGNLVLPKWKDSLSHCPRGITVQQYEIERGKSQWKKIVEHAGKRWESLLWDSDFLGKLRPFEYSVSAQPVDATASRFIMAAFDAIESKFSACSPSLKLKKEFKNNKFPPGNKMFLFAKRPVVVMNSTPLDEGRASEFFNFSGSGEHISDLDFRFNRIPEVLAIDQKNKAELPMSFHDVHLLGNHAVFQLIITPRAYVHADQLSWEFRLVAVKVLGKKQVEIAQSPSKQVQRRKAVFIDLDEDENETQSPSKKQKLTKSPSSSRSSSTISNVA